MHMRLAVEIRSRRYVVIKNKIRVLLFFIKNLYSHEQNIYKYTQIMQWKTNIKIIYAMFSEKGGEGPKMPLIPDLGE